jgi:hypothetical protein
MRVWIGVSLFFGVGVAIGLSAAEALMRQPSWAGGLAGAVVLGAGAGAFGTWVVFAIAARVAHRIRFRGLSSAAPGTSSQGDEARG